MKKAYSLLVPFDPEVTHQWHVSGTLRSGNCSHTGVLFPYSSLWTIILITLKCDQICSGKERKISLFIILNGTRTGTKRSPHLPEAICLHKYSWKDSIWLLTPECVETWEIQGTCLPPLTMPISVDKGIEIYKVYDPHGGHLMTSSEWRSWRYNRGLLGLKAVLLLVRSGIWGQRPISYKWESWRSNRVPSLRPLSYYTIAPRLEPRSPLSSDVDTTPVFKSSTPVVAQVTK